MGSIFKHSVLGGAIGLLLARVCWLVGSLVRRSWSVVRSPWQGACRFLATDQGRRTKDQGRRKRHPLDSPRCLAMVSAFFRWQRISKPAAALLRGSGQVADKSLLEALHPNDVHAVENAFQQAHKTRRVQRVLCRFMLAERSAPGPFVHVRLDIWAKLDRAGKLKYFLCNLLDLTPIFAQTETELKSARHALTQAKESMRAVGKDLHRLKRSYRELYQNAPVMYFSMDSAGRLVTFNDTLVHTLGYERKDLQSKEYTALLAPATLKSYVTIAESMPKREREVETQWRKQDGTVIDVWLHSVPVYDEHGRFVRYRSAALDMSEKNRLANELRARGDELERTNQTLRTINGELEAFTHVVSHDLKEPLRTLQAFSHLLAKEHAAQLGPDGFQYVNHLIRASRRLGTLIDDLLNLSRAGRIAHVQKPFNLIAIVATVRQDLVDLIQRKQASVLTEGSLPGLVGDSARITQLLTNLVANGLKYNQNPQPQVVIGAMPCAADPGRVTIRVRDNGIGIAPAFHEQIFGIFRRLHQSEEYEGTGAGLAICQKIVAGHGGTIWVESELGQGATFYFTLLRIPRPAARANGAGQTRTQTQEHHDSPPRRDVRHADAPPAFVGQAARLPFVGQAARLPADSTARGPLALRGANGSAAKPHIVLVDDKADVGMIIQRLGERDGLAIAWFPTAEEALAALQIRRADLLLLDVNLPGMSGVELCERLRQIEHFKEMPVAMFTPDQDAESLQELRAAGADFFLSKDLLCQPVEWQRKLQELLEQIRQPSAH